MNTPLQSTSPPGFPLSFLTSLRSARSAWSRPVCRLGLATRGENDLQPADLLHAIDRGVNFLNWCGSPDALSQAVAGLGPRRQDLMLCVQFEARTAQTAEQELAR